jgi:DnaJ-domain-containing protein 1
MEAYPLSWPAGWPRTDDPQLARFKVTMGEAVQHLYDQLDMLGADNIVVSSNMRLRIDGKPLANQNRLDDEGVAVYFDLRGKQQCIPCDKWLYVKDNVRAIGLTVEALRGLERWGAKEMVDAAFAGFKALPASIELSEHMKRTWHDVLEVLPTASPEVIKGAYKRLAGKYHPDNPTSGDEYRFKEVQNAWNEIKDNF